MGAKRLTTELLGSREESLAADAPQAVGERLLALVEPDPGAQRLVRRAWRSSQRLGAELDLLWVRAADSLGIYGAWKSFTVNAPNQAPVFHRKLPGPAIACLATIPPTSPNDYVHLPGRLQGT